MTDSGRGPDNLTQRSFVALRWSYFGVVARICVQFFAVVVLARILGPEAFGVYAFMVIVWAVCNIVAEHGVGPALIQRSELTDRDVRVAFTKLAASGLAMTLALLLAAPLLARTFDHPEAAESLRIMSVVFLVLPFNVIGEALLRRRLDLRSVQIATVGSYMVGYVVVGLGCALAGLGAISLALGFSSYLVLAAAWRYIFTRHPVRPLWHSNQAMRAFELRVFGTNLVNWIAESIDQLIVGKSYGAHSLGLYAVSYNLVRTAANHIVVSLQSVVLPAASIAQIDHKRVQRGYQALLGAVSIAIFPLFGLLAALSETVVLVVYGQAWERAAGLIVPLSLAMTFHTLTAVSGPILWGIGAVGRELKVQAVMAALMVSMLLLLSRWSMEAIAWGVLALYALRALWLVRVLTWSIALDMRSVFKATRGGIILALMLAAAGFFFDQYIHFWLRNPWLRLAVDGVVVGATSFLLLLCAGRWLVAAEVKQSLGRIEAPWAHRLRRWIG